MYDDGTIVASCVVGSVVKRKKQKQFRCRVFLWKRHFERKLVQHVSIDAVSSLHALASCRQYLQWHSRRLTETLGHHADNSQGQ